MVNKYLRGMSVALRPARRAVEILPRGLRRTINPFDLPSGSREGAPAADSLQSGSRPERSHSRKPFMPPTPPRTRREPIFNLPAVILPVGGGPGRHPCRCGMLLSDESDFAADHRLGGDSGRWSVAYGGTSASEVMSALASVAPDAALAPAAGAGAIRAGGRRGKALDRPDLRLPARLLGPCADQLGLACRLRHAHRPALRRRAAPDPGARRPPSAARSSTRGSIPLQILPMIGASAAVSGMMAAASWFMFAPAALAAGRPRQRAA